MDLNDILKSFDIWADSIDRKNQEALFGSEGWESGFPQWDQLLKSAQKIMLKNSVSPQELKMLDRCWQMSEECEELAEFARDHSSETLAIVIQLTESKDSDVRWQSYDVLGNHRDGIEEVLAKGLDDEDPYVRQRAFLAFGRDPARISSSLVEKMLSDSDPDVRRVAWEMARRSANPALIQKTRERLEADESSTASSGERVS